MAAERSYSRQAGYGGLGSHNPGPYGSFTTERLVLVLLTMAVTSILAVAGWAIFGGGIEYDDLKYSVTVWLAGMGVAFIGLTYRAVRAGYPMQILRPWGGLGMNPGRPRLSAPIPVLLAGVFLIASSAALLLAEPSEIPPANNSALIDDIEDLETELDQNSVTIESKSIDQLADAAARLVEKYDPVLDTRLDSCIVWPLSRNIQFKFNSIQFDNKPAQTSNIQIIESIASSMRGFDYNIGYILVAGFTDPVGDHEVNFNLSQKRADLVAAVFECYYRGAEACEQIIDELAKASGDTSRQPRQQKSGQMHIETIGRGEGFEVRRDHRTDAEKRGVELMYCVRDKASL